MHSWQNSTRSRDVVKVLWCHSHLVWLVLRVPFLHAFVCFFVVVFITVSYLNTCSVDLPGSYLL